MLKDLSYHQMYYHDTLRLSLEQNRELCLLRSDLAGHLNRPADLLRELADLLRELADLLAEVTDLLAEVTDLLPLLAAPIDLLLFYFCALRILLQRRLLYWFSWATK